MKEKKKPGLTAGPGHHASSAHTHAKRKSTGKKASPAPCAPAATEKMKIEELYVKAQIAIMSDQYEQADGFFAHIVALAPSNPEYLDAYGSFLAEYVPHKRQEAIEYLKQACALAPDTGFEKFMYLGQVLDACGRAREAEAAMRAGVEILKNENDAENSNGEFLTSALCSLAELLMGLIHDDDDMMDACYAADAALPELLEVEALLEQAMTSSDGKSPEPLQAMCGLRVLQGREEEALELLKESLKVWWYKGRGCGEDGGGGGDNGGGEDGVADGIADGVADEVDEVDDDDDDEDALPSYEFRFETAKLLLELDTTTDTAAEILEELVKEMGDS